MYCGHIPPWLISFTCKNARASITSLISCINSFSGMYFSVPILFLIIYSKLTSQYWKKRFSLFWPNTYNILGCFRVSLSSGYWRSNLVEIMYYWTYSYVLYIFTWPILEKFKSFIYITSFVSSVDYFIFNEGKK